MNGTRAASVTRRRRSAIMSAWRSSSMAHGPPMSARGASPPMVTAPTVTARVLTMSLVVQRRLDERGEERMGFPWTRPELRMELAGDKPRVIGQLHDLHQLLLRPDAGN